MTGLTLAKAAEGRFKTAPFRLTPRRAALKNLLSDVLLEQANGRTIFWTGATGSGRDACRELLIRLVRAVSAGLNRANRWGILVIRPRGA